MYQDLNSYFTILNKPIQNNEIKVSIEKLNIFNFDSKVNIIFYIKIEDIKNPEIYSVTQHKWILDLGKLILVKASELKNYDQVKPNLQELISSIYTLVSSSAIKSFENFYDFLGKELFNQIFYKVSSSSKHVYLIMFTMWGIISYIIHKNFDNSKGFLSSKFKKNYKCFVVEGLDVSGKETLSKSLVNNPVYRNKLKEKFKVKDIIYMTSPDYETDTGRHIKRILQDKTISNENNIKQEYMDYAMAVNRIFAMLELAMKREDKIDIKTLVIYDRYFTSSSIYNDKPNLTLIKEEEKFLLDIKLILCIGTFTEESKKLHSELISNKIKEGSSDCNETMAVQIKTNYNIVNNIGKDFNLSNKIPIYYYSVGELFEDENIRAFLDRILL